MKKMLFETMLSGHRMEYIHHVYMGMIQNTEDDYVIVVQKEFEDKKSLYKWPKSENVRFVYITEDIVRKDGVGLVRKSFFLTKVLRGYLQKEQVDSVFLISLINYIIAMPFLISSKYKVSGIIYSIYLFNWVKSSWKRRLQDMTKYLLMRFTPCLKTVFILNDEESAHRLNKLYCSHKFKYITDPFNELDYHPHNIRQELGVVYCDQLFLHFGGIAKRKGSLEILKAIALLSEKKRKESVFVFAGKVYDSIREEFYRLMGELPSDSRILLYDEFCSNEFIADLCVSSDFILAPYQETNRSSGLLGYAAYYGTPMIGPSDGLIGKLIHRYRLGETLPEGTAECIAEKVSEVVPYRIDSDYNGVIKVEDFVKVLFLAF